MAGIAVRLLLAIFEKLTESFIIGEMEMQQPSSEFERGTIQGIIRWTVSFLCLGRL